MSRPAGRKTRWMLSALLGCAALCTLTGAFGIDKQEFECEQAAAHLADCCPGFDPHSLRCYQAGCDGSPGPDLTAAGSECIIGATCDDLVSSGSCGAPTRVVCP